MCNSERGSGIGFLVGIVFVLSLRVLGVGSYAGIRPNAAMPAAAKILAVSAIVFWTGAIVAGANALWYQLTVHRELDGWPETGDAPAQAELIAGISLVVWIAVIFFGRFIM